MKKIQILWIHGGNTFKNKKDYLDYLLNKEISLENYNVWYYSNNLDKKLGEKFEVIRPTMPLKENAKYEEWKIIFEHYFKLVDGNCVLMGISLGGIFLAKYLSENIFPKKINAVYLFGSPYDNSVEGEDLCGGFKLKKDLSLIYKNCSKFKMYFSSDDPVIPLSHAKKYQEKLKAEDVIILKNAQGHFRAESLPEIIKQIKKDCL
jgi:predicted alpha/beta hydrolase family esterase